MYGAVAAEFADAATAAADGATPVERIQAAISYFQVATGVVETAGH